MTVTPWRGQGIGRQLLSACIEKAFARGMTRIELETRVDNLAAIALYERLGFVRETVKARGMCFEGCYFDTLQMSLLAP